MTNALPIEASGPDEAARRFHHLVPRRIAQGALGVFMGSGSDDKKQGTNTSEPRDSDGGPDARRNKSSVPPFSRREKHAGAVVGAIAGAVVGAFAGPPGLIAGSALGAAMGAVAGAALDRIDAERDRRDRELDDEIGITRGNMGAYPVTMRPPSAPRESMLDMLSGDLASSPNLFEAPASSSEPASPVRALAVEELRFDAPAVTEADDRATVEERDRLTSAESPLAMLARAAAQDLEMDATARPSSAATVAVAVAVPPAAVPPPADAPVEASPAAVPEDAPSSTTAVTLSLGAPSSDAVVDETATGDSSDAPSSTTAVAAPIATLAPEAPMASEGEASADEALAEKSGEHEAELAAAATRPSGSVPVATTSVVPPSGDVAKLDVPDDVELPRASQA